MGSDIINDFDSDYLQTLGGMIYETPDKGITVSSRPSSEHPIFILANRRIGIDIWCKIYRNEQ